MAQNPGGHDRFHPTTSYDARNYQSQDGGPPHQSYDSNSGHDLFPPPPLQPNDSDRTPLANGYHPPPPPSSQQKAGATCSQPIADAVNLAFDNSAAAHQVPAEVIAKITEQVRSQVIDSLRQEFSSGQPYPSQYQSQQQPYSQPFSSGNGSAHQPIPSATPASSFSPVQTAGLGSVPPMQSPSQRSSQLYGSSPTDSKPTHTPPTPDKEYGDTYFKGNSPRDRGYCNRPSRDEASSRPIPVSEKRRSTTSTASASSPVRSNTMREDLSSRYGDRTGEGNGASTSDRPTTTRVRTDDEETVVEKMWQPLFDADHQPTARMSQFLRGIALHLIEDYEPKNSLVVGPRKMKKFFDEMKLGEELFPWKDIFALPTAHLSSLYTALGCQHHIIPRSAAPFEAPSLAALTPHGFAAFMICIIHAHPSHEFHRLAMTVKHWPVSNADERKERLPKELSRRLLPKQGSEAGRRKLYDALRKFNIPGPFSSVPPPPSHPPPSSHPPPPASAPPQNYGAAYPPPSSTAQFNKPSSSNPRSHRYSYIPPPSSGQPLHDEPEDISDASSGPSIPIERERKPYIAKEGTGKIYEDDLSRTKSTTAIPPPQPIPQPTHRDSINNQPTGSFSHRYSTSASNIMPPPRTRTGSLASDPFGRTNPPSKTKRGGSPPYGRGLGDLHSSTAYWPDDERYYDAEPLGRVTSHDERAHDRRYAKFDEDAPNGRPNSYAGFGSGYGGNPPLGTGERRY